MGFTLDPAGVSHRSGYLLPGRNTNLAALAPMRAPPLPCATLPAAWVSPSCAWVLGRVHGVPRPSAGSRADPEDADQVAMRVMRAVAGGCPDTTSPVDGALRPPLVRVSPCAGPLGCPAPAESPKTVGFTLDPAGVSHRSGYLLPGRNTNLAALAPMRAPPLPCATLSAATQGLVPRGFPGVCCTAWIRSTHARYQTTIADRCLSPNDDRPQSPNERSGLTQYSPGSTT